MLYSVLKKCVVDRNLLEEGDVVVVGVSGGIDSMVLLDALVRLSKGFKLKIVPAHVNYGLRGRNSDDDEKLVREVADKFGMTCEVLVKKPSAGANLQDSARRIRYNFFSMIANKYNARVIAIAHNRGDQAETVILHMLRGSGLSGLTGMGHKAIVGDKVLIRPMLSLAREKIEKYATKRGITFREDASNKKSVYARNSIRHRVMPLLAEFNPRVEESISRMAEMLLEDDETLGLFATRSLDECVLGGDGDHIVIDRQLYSRLPSSLRRRLLRGAYERLVGSTVNLKSDQVIRMDEIALSVKGRGSYRLPSPWKFTRERDKLIIRRSATKCDRG
jgi:tRNA(Ile)-lysidine synthase